MSSLPLPQSAHSPLAGPRISRRQLVLGSSALALGLPFTRPANGAGMVELRLLGTTDVHVHVHPYDYYRDRPENTVGLAKTAQLVAAARAEKANSLLLDNGDWLQGNPMGDYMAYERGLNDGDVHPMIAAMNTLGIEVATLGNHEFNYGLEFLHKALDGGVFPWVLSNVAKGRLAGAARDDDTLVPPYVLLDRDLVDDSGARLPIRIGVIGFTPPQIMLWDRAHLEGNVAVRDIVGTATAYVPEMKERGADIIIALCHSGIDASPQTVGAENAALYLAAVEGIDVIMTGHHHLVLPGPDYENVPGVDAAAGLLRGKPAVMAGFWGSHLGVIDLTLMHDGGNWLVVDHQSAARPIYTREGREVIPLVTADPAIMAATETEHEATLTYVRRPVGQISAPVNSYFALVADDPSVQIVSNAQIWYVEQILVGTEYEGLPVLSAAAPFKAGGRGGPDYYTDVPAGAIAIKNVADLYLYPNTVRAVLIDGALVGEWLERSAGMFNQIAADGAEQALLDPEFPSFNFDIIDGVTYEIDLSQPARYALDGSLAAPEAHRIRNLMYAGAPIDPSQMFVVATNNYRASGGGNFPGNDGTTIIVEAPDTNRDVIVRYIVEQGVINPSADGNWRFASLPQADNLVFDSAPAAQALADAIPNVSFVGLKEDGFATFRLDLSA